MSPDIHSQTRELGTPDRMTMVGNDITPPRASPLGNRIRTQTPKDTIPLSAKPPRKQRSSRFVQSEKIEIERLPSFNGCSSVLSLLYRDTNTCLEVSAEGRPDLFVQKLHQCHVVFDFNDASAELKGKQIKAQTLHEMLEYITTQRGIITDSLYPEVVNMVRDQGLC